jgi:hypothetical protein
MEAADIVTTKKPIPLTQNNFVSKNVEVGLAFGDDGGTAQAICADPRLQQGQGALDLDGIG